MAFNNSLTARLDELRSRNPPRVTTESNTGNNTPFRYSGSYMTSPPQTSSSADGPGIQRRFTADLSKMVPMAPIGQQSQVANTDMGELPAITFKKAELLERKRQEYQDLQDRRAKFKAEMEMFNQQSAEQQLREQQELDQMAKDLQIAGFNPGYQSEPTTPPEHRGQGFPSTFGRTNRYSASSLASPPGLSSRSHRSGSQLTSPPTELAQSQASSDNMPSKSVPGSRRGSNDRVAAYVPETSGSARRNAASNRYSMPVTGSRPRTHETVPEHAGMGPLNTTSFLFDDDDKAKESALSPDAKRYMQMTDDKFPILVRREEYPGVLSASSAALDLALSQSPGPEEPKGTNSTSATNARHRLSEQNIPSSALSSLSTSHSNTNGGTGLGAQYSPDVFGSTRQMNRHSMEASLAAYSKANLPNQLLSSESSRPTLANIHPSYSTNDVPTLKSTPATTNEITPPKTSAQQHFHNHNASLGRIPPNAINNRHSRELSGGDNRRDDQSHEFQPMSSALHANATPFGPSANAYASSDPHLAQIQAANTPINFAAGQPQYGQYGMHIMNMAMSQMQLNNGMTSPVGFPGQSHSNFQAPSAVSSYSTLGSQPGRFQDNQTRIMQQRRLQNGEENSRFNNVQLENLHGEILGLCKDQHGCRYLQKKLEERNPDNIQIIFGETNEHVVELMTDPFGNYLCQKLLEYSNDEQRTKLIRNAAPEMVKIALNSHGTRALQKMIEFVSTAEQTQIIIEALNGRVVDLIQDLNGNHVIQKCLNRLSPQDAQFIFAAVGENCVTVGTHRHGCCVLQRCMDHASGYQKAQLISQITEAAYHLVQDPFGNYVLQYIVDIQESCFTDPLCYTFQGRIPQLSKQKFSSNVIEKCLRGAQHSVTRMMIEEMLNANELEKMLRDSYANYVVQTAIDYGDAEIKARLIEAIRPILPVIRQTPHGRRIHSKIMAMDGQRNGQGRFSRTNTPQDRSTGQIPLNPIMTSSPMTGAYTATTTGYTAPITSFAPQANGYHHFQAPSPGTYVQYPPQGQTFNNGIAPFVPFGTPQQAAVQQSAPFARMPPVNGGFF